MEYSIWQGYIPAKGVSYDVPRSLPAMAKPQSVDTGEQRTDRCDPAADKARGELK